MKKCVDCGKYFNPIHDFDEMCVDCEIDEYNDDMAWQEIYEEMEDEE